MKQTINQIVKEIKYIPVDRLEDPYQLVYSLALYPEKKEKVKKKILSFAGIFSDMNDKDYADYLNQTKLIRQKLF